MACGVLHHHHLFFIHHRNSSTTRNNSFSISTPYTSTKLLINPKYSPRFQKLPKSSNKNPSTLPQKPKSPERSKGSDPDPDLSSGTWVFDRLREGFNVDGLLLDILSIALPAALALAAEPITSLVDTAFVGHLGSVELAAVGVSVSVYNLVSKLFNVPLLNITTSFVAEEQGLITKEARESAETVQDRLKDQDKKILLPSISTSLALAAGLGLAEAVALFAGSGSLMNAMGISPDSPMRLPAEQFLTLRAFGTPPIVLALAAQGTFRGFKDTKTPLYAVGAGNILNALLDPILIFSFGLGISGAAIATVISEYLTAFILLWKLNEKVSFIVPNIDAGRVAQYLKSGALLTGRSLAVLVTLTLATSMAAREGPIPMAGYQICIQVWMALSLLNDALALAGQALLATDYSQGNYDQARKVLYKILQIGLLMGVALGVLLLISFGTLSKLFTTDSEVLQIAGYGTLFVAASQPMNALAFVLDGLYYGVSDFEYAAYSMLLIGLISSVFIFAAAPFYGLAGVWAGLFLFMTLRVVAGFLRLGTRSGPWKLLWSDMEKDDDV